jgi:hypothetical protein
MNSPTVGALRLVRCGAFGATASGWALAAHVLAGGAPPDLPTTAVVVGICSMSGWLLAGHRRHWPVLLTVLAAVQAFAHVTLSVAMAGPTGGHPAHTLAGWLPSAMMLAWHAVAVAATGLALSHGEQALWCLLSWLRILPALPGPTRPAPAPARLPVEAAVRVFWPAGPERGLFRRGPPMRERPSLAA